jgi:hypothetical protein
LANAGLRIASAGPHLSVHLIEEAMHAETESVVNEIKESLSLLRRHL